MILYQSALKKHFIFVDGFEKQLFYICLCSATQKNVRIKCLGLEASKFAVMWQSTSTKALITNVGIDKHSVTES